MPENIKANLLFSVLVKKNYFIDCRRFLDVKIACRYVISQKTEYL